MEAEEFFNNGFGEDVQKVHRNHVIDLMEAYHAHQSTELKERHDELLKALKEAYDTIDAVIDIGEWKDKGQIGSILHEEKRRLNKSLNK